MNNYNRIMGIDYGQKRVGIALTDPLKIIASPFKVLNNDENLLKNIKDIISDKNVDEIVLGCPFQHSESEKENPLIKKILEFKELIEKETGINIILWDETLTSKEAEKRIIEAIPKRMKRRDKSLIDLYAATIILEEYMRK